jgi:glycosyltransferase 2 family protein
MSHKKNIKKKLAFFSSIILTVMIFIIIFLQINKNDFIENFKQINLFYFSFAMIILFITFLILAYRWKLIIKDYKNSPLSKCIKVFFVSQSFNIITPSNIGDFSKAYFFKDKKYTLKIGASTIIFERIIDLFAIATFSILGIIIIDIQSKITFLLKILMILMFSILVLLLTANFKKNSIIVKIIKIIIPFNKIKNLVIDMLSYFETLRKDKINVLKIFLLTYLFWFLSLIQGYVLFMAIGLTKVPNINFFIIIALIPISILIGMIPITVGGMGTRELAMIVTFSPYAPASIMILFGLMFSIRYIFSSLLGLIWLNKFINKK